MYLWPSITAKNETIELKDKARNIGVTFDTTLTMSHHVNDVVKGAFYIINSEISLKSESTLVQILQKLLFTPLLAQSLIFVTCSFRVSRTMKIISYKMFKMRQPEL